MKPYNPYSTDYEHYYHGPPPTDNEYQQMLYYMDMKKRIIKERQ